MKFFGIGLYWMGWDDTTFTEVQTTCPPASTVFTTYPCVAQTYERGGASNRGRSVLEDGLPDNSIHRLPEPLVRYS